MDTIRNYRNSVWLRFENRGSSFTLDVPHHKHWVAIMRFLKSRGFSISENDTFKKHYAFLSKYHKIGYKKDVALLMEINPISIEIEFGNIKNLWKGMAQGFWSSKSDDCYTHLSYLENLAVKLEIKKLLDFCKRYNMQFLEEDDRMNPEQFIINKLKINSHIHGKVECLNDIKLAIKEDSYNFTHNSNDKNKKKIICGDKKYFYDSRTKRLSCGIAWHNINNMWWVITNKTFTNIASFELFDFDPTLPRRKATNPSKIHNLLKKFEEKRDYKKCMMIQNYATRIGIAA